MSITKKQIKEAEESQEFEEDLRNLQEESLDRDIENNKSNLYSSEEMPNDIYQYKRMRLIPNSEADYPGLIDKDMVLANVGKKPPDPEYLTFITETIDALNIFSVTRVIKYPIKNDKGYIVRYSDREVVIPDPEFDCVRSFLKATLKSNLTLSRAMGDKREAILDRAQFVDKSIQKGQSKNKYE